jgi:hypothetical protein
MPPGLSRALGNDIFPEGLCMHIDVVPHVGSPGKSDDDQQDKDNGGNGRKETASSFIGGYAALQRSSLLSCHGPGSGNKGSVGLPRTLAARIRR